MVLVMNKTTLYKYIFLLFIMYIFFDGTKIYFIHSNFAETIKY